MSGLTASKVLRLLARELRLVYGKQNISEVPAYMYIRDQLARFEVTGAKICREEEEVKNIAETYLCYLESTRKQEELSAHYRGKGERSIESSAEIVGLKLPKLYSDEPPAKTPDH